MRLSVHRQCAGSRLAPRQSTAPRTAFSGSITAPKRAVACDAASLQFIRGISEPTVPEVKLMRSRTGTSGSALFIFDKPSVFEASGELGEITGLFMIDDEGELSTTDVKAKFVNGKPQIIEARYNMRSQFEWDRFIRFMDRFAESAGLGFEKGAGP